MAYNDMVMPKYEDDLSGNEMTRQRRYQIRRRRALCCELCGKPRGLSLSKVLCGECSERKLKRQRERLGFKEWAPGGPGRPPLGAAVVGVKDSEDSVK